MLQDGRKSSTLDYVTPAERPPIGYRTIARKVVFAIGAGMLVFGICASLRPYRQEFAMTSAIGAALMALMFPWRKRERQHDE